MLLRFKGLNYTEYGMAANQHHAEYAQPEIRSPSPTSSIGTVYGDDQTSFSDCEEQLTQFEFEKKWEERLALNMSRPEELLADKEPLLPRPPPGSMEERQLFEQVMMNLHETVRNLEDNELFERTLLRGSQAALETLPTTSDIDELMRSMMVAPTPSVNLVPEVGSIRGRSNSRGDGLANGSLTLNGHDHLLDANISFLSTGIVPGKRSRNGSRRN
ncbi:hypothetical protein H0H92_009513 [Tricholoma furcatifolium]|nr:hypothetical protein H0H92_009513 [Tricholoma furcatifolium]